MEAVFFSLELFFSMGIVFVLLESVFVLLKTVLCISNPLFSLEIRFLCFVYRSARPACLASRPYPDRPGQLAWTAAAASATNFFPALRAGEESKGLGEKGGERGEIGGEGMGRTEVI